MTVFKKYLKIANTYTLMILAYTAIFLGLAIFTGTYNSTSTDYKSMLSKEDSSNLFVTNHNFFVSFFNLDSVTSIFGLR